ncbi:serine/threonine protein kinase Ran1 [Ancistrocladus abbreviatus]
MDQGEFLTLVALAEASSEHPLAKVIFQYACHFHLFENSLAAEELNNGKDLKFSGWLLDESAMFHRWKMSFGWKSKAD